MTVQTTPPKRANMNFNNIGNAGKLTPADPTNPIYTGLIDANGQINLGTAAFLALQQIIQVKQTQIDTITGGLSIGAAGASIYAGEQAGKMKFKNLKAASPKVSITEDENGNIVLDIDIADTLENYPILEGGLIPSRFIPNRETVDYLGDVQSEAEMLALAETNSNVSIGDTCIRKDLNLPDGEEWVCIGSDATLLSSWQPRKDTIAGVTAILKVSGGPGQTGPIVIDKAFIGLPSVKDVDTTNPANIQWGNDYAVFTLEQKLQALAKLSSLSGPVSAGANGVTTIANDVLLNANFAPDVKPGSLAELPASISADRTSLTRVLIGMLAKMELITKASFASYSTNRTVDLAAGTDKVKNVRVTGDMVLSFTNLAVTPAIPIPEKVYVLYNPDAVAHNITMPDCTNLRKPLTFALPAGKTAIANWMFSGLQSGETQILAKHYVGGYSVED